MQTTRSVTSTARRAQIVAAAARVIAREGLAKASFGRIAAEAQLSSPGLISYHFADKDELLGVLADTALADCATSIQEAVDVAGDAAAALATYLRAFVRWQEAHRDEVSALWRLSAGWRRADGTPAFDEAPVRDPLLAILETGRGSGALRPVSPVWTAETILCAVEGYDQARKDDPALDADAFADALVELFLHGLVP